MQRASFCVLLSGIFLIFGTLLIAEEAGKEAVSSNPEGEMCAQAAMQAAAAAEGRPYLVENEKYLVIGNDHIAACFARDTLEMAALVDVAAGGNVLASGTGPLWKMTLADDKRQTTEIDSTFEAERTFSINKTEERVELYLSWSKISTPEENEIISARARIAAEADSPHLRWKIDVECDSEKRGLWEVDFPRIESILPPGEAEKTALLLPSSIGRVVENPFAEDKKYENRYPTHPRSASMQFSALYGPAGGLFFGAYDGDMFVKTFYHEFSKDSKTLTYYVRNLPEDRGDIGIDYKMPYEFVMTTFDGDWFTACKIYRQWAIRQVWCSKGPLHTRKDVPQWFKELGYWMIAWEQRGIGRGKTYEEKIKPKIGEGVDQTLLDIKANAEQLGVPTAVHFYGWHARPAAEGFPDYFPPLIGEEPFKKQVKAIHDMGVRIMPYINGCIWNRSLPSYKERDVVKYVIKDEHGKPRPQGPWDWMCYYTKFWQNEMKEISVTLVRDYNVDGIYYDQLAAESYECFDPAHGHAKGGGNYNAVGIRKLLRQCREAIRKTNPEAIMTNECLCEYYMDCMDGSLLSLDQSEPGTVPAFQAVYNDYFIIFGNMVLNYKEPYKVMPMAIGESFIYGDQLGWFNIWPIFTPGHPRDELSVYWEDEEARKNAVDFVRNIAQLRYHGGRKFLVYGEMLKPLTFKNELPQLEGWWQFGGREGLRRLPAVMNSVWKAPDGTLGLVFCNITDNAHRVEFTLDLKKYGMPDAKSYVLIERNIDGTEKVVEKYDSAFFTRDIAMPALKGYILEVRPE